MISSRLRFVVVMGMLGMLVPRSAMAQSSKDDTDLRWELGNLLFGRGNYNGALAEFLEVYKHRPLAQVEYNLGLTHVFLGRPVEASQWLGMCLSRPVCVDKTRHAYAQKVYEEQASQIGTVSIDVGVAHVEVEIDGRKQGQAPLTMRLANGTHIVSVAPDGYEPQYKEIVVAGGTRTQVDFRLVPFQGQPGRLMIESPVPAVEVFVDDKPVGKTPLFASIKVVPGSHTIKVGRLGYRAFTQSLEVHGDELRTVRVKLEEDAAWIAAYGSSLQLELSEQNAVVTVDGHSRGEYLGPLRLAPGAHHIRIERAGFVTVEREVMVRLGKTARETVVLEANSETLVKRREEAALRKKWGKGLVGAGVGVAALGAISLTVVAMRFRSQRCNTVEKASPGCNVYPGWMGAAGGFALLGFGAVSAGIWLLERTKESAPQYPGASNVLSTQYRVAPFIHIMPGETGIGLAGTY